MLRLATLLLLVAACDCRGPVPEAPVELVRDGLGITHVRARSARDAMYGGGYAMARDRLTQMEIVRRRAFGTRSEVLGPAFLGDDLGARTFAFARLGAADAERTLDEQPDDWWLVEAWVAGVNLRIAEVRTGIAPRPAGLGPEGLAIVPQPWTVEDAFAVAKFNAFGLSSTFEQEILATLVDKLAPGLKDLPLAMPAQDAFITPVASAIRRPGRDGGGASRAPLPLVWRKGRRPLAEGGASNNWAVRASHTDTGKPYLAGDPHQQLSSPSRLWPVHLTGGELDVVGFAYAGTPGVQLGHNARVAWAATTSFADVMDLFDVPIDAARTRIGFDGESQALELREETIRVKGGEPVTFTVRELPGVGVIVPDELLPVAKESLVEGELLLTWTGFRPSIEASSYLALDRAQDLDGFEAALALAEVGAQTFVAADAKSIGLKVHANVPDRGDPSKRPMPWRILPGSEAGAAWSGFLSDRRLPRLRDPSRGWVASANNDPFGFTRDGTVENDPWYYGAFFANGFRAARIDSVLRTMLSNGGRATRENMQALQCDTRSVLAESLLKHLDEAMVELHFDPTLEPWRDDVDLQKIADLLLRWNLRRDTDSPAAAAMLGLEWFAARRVFEDRAGRMLFDAVAAQNPAFWLGQLRNVMDVRFRAADAFVPEGRRVLMLRALGDTLTWLRSYSPQLRPSEFPLSLVQRAEFAPLLAGRFSGDARTPVAGGSDTVNVAPVAFLAEGAPRADASSSEMALYRMVVGFAADGTPEASINFARGTSEDPASPHYAAQHARWAACEFVPLPFRKSDVEAQATDRVVLPAAP